MRKRMPTRDERLENLRQLDRRVELGYLRKVEHEDLVLYNYTDHCVFEKAWDEYTLNARGTVYHKETGIMGSRGAQLKYNLRVNTQALEILNEKLKKAKDSPYYAAVVPINARGEVLLGKRLEDGIWTTPAGGGSDLETPEECAVRECWEEANLRIDQDRLQLICVKAAPNGKPVHCYLYETAQEDLNTRMDPDREVKEWVWFSRDQIPREMSRKKNQNRLETVNQAFMKYYGLTKGIWELAEDLEKGGKPARVGEVRTWGGIQYKKHPNKKWVAISGKHKGKEMGKFKEEPQYLDFADEGKGVKEEPKKPAQEVPVDKPSSADIKERAGKTPLKTGPIPGWGEFTIQDTGEEGYRRYKVLEDGVESTKMDWIPSSLESAERLKTWMEAQANAYKYTRKEFRDIFRKASNSGRIGPRQGRTLDARHEALVRKAVEEGYRVPRKVLDSQPRLAGIPKELDNAAQKKTNMFASVDLSKVPKKRLGDVTQMLKDSNEVVAAMGVRFVKPLDFKAGSSLKGLSEGEDAKDQWGTQARYWGGGGPTRMVELVKASHAASSIMHEIGHAIDYAMAKSSSTEVTRSTEMVRGVVPDEDKVLASKYKELFDLVKGSLKYMHAREVHGRKHASYLYTDTEVFARAFEVYSLGKAEELIAKGKISPGFVDKYLPDIFRDPTVEMRFRAERKILMDEYDALTKKIGTRNQELIDQVRKDPEVEAIDDQYAHREKVVERMNELAKKDPKHQKLENQRKALNDKLNDLMERKLKAREEVPQIPAKQKKEYIGKITKLMDDILSMDEVRKSDAMIELAERLRKGGPGSGIKGHKTAPKDESPKPGSREAKMQKLQEHLRMMKEGGVFPNVKTSTGKPVVTNINQAEAHKYNMQDHMDAMNTHYEAVQRLRSGMEKIKAAGGSPPKEATELMRFHEKQMRLHMKSRDKLEVRHNQLNEVKEKQGGHAGNPEVKKSVTQMGGAMGDPDLNTGDYAQASNAADPELLESLYQGMEGFGYGDLPREFPMGKGRLHLSMVDDGMYSGYFTRADGDLEDNARVRIDKINLPELCMLIQAKEWNRSEEKEPVEVPETMGDSPEVEKFNVGAVPAAFSENAEMKPEAPESSEALRILELVAKLTGR